MVLPAHTRGNISPREMTLGPHTVISQASRISNGHISNRKTEPAGSSITAIRRLRDLTTCC